MLTMSNFLFCKERDLQKFEFEMVVNFVVRPSRLSLLYFKIIKIWLLRISCMF